MVPRSHSALGVTEEVEVEAEAGERRRMIIVKMGAMIRMIPHPDRLLVLEVGPGEGVAGDEGEQTMAIKTRKTAIHHRLWLILPN